MAKEVAILLAIALTGCDSGWSGAHREAGPLPLSSPDKPIIRYVDKRTIFGQGELTRLIWYEGNNPVLAEDRIKPLVESIPKELHDRLYSTRDVPAKLYAPFRDAGNTYEYIYDTWVVVVSLNPDILIISAYETPVGPHWKQPQSWNSHSTDQARREYLKGRVESIPRTRWPIEVGTLVPWSKEMYVVSTDPKVESGRLKFENNEATIPLPTGKLVLSRRDEDVNVRRE